MLPNPEFWRGKRVLLTGHTGFKGAWAALWLTQMGAQVTGLSLEPETKPNLFEIADVASQVTHHIADLRDKVQVEAIIKSTQPEIVLHLAAQALVRRSYREPSLTFETNVMGTAYLLDALADCASVKTILVITSDKVYANDESGRAFQETDALGGHDPYSASKAAVELLVASFRAARFDAKGVTLATARGGNVIGGGDYSEDRIVPDIVRAASKNEPLILRNPNATRPWQHVLDCLCGYFVFTEHLASGQSCPLALNIGPDPTQPITVAQIAERLLPALGATQSWQLHPDVTTFPREMASLALNPTRARTLGIMDRLPGPLALEWTADWYQAQGHSPTANMSMSQIHAYSCKP